MKEQPEECVQYINVACTVLYLHSIHVHTNIHTVYTKPSMQDNTACTTLVQVSQSNQTHHSEVKGDQQTVQLTLSGKVICKITHGTCLLSG